MPTVSVDITSWQQDGDFNGTASFFAAGQEMHFGNNGTAGPNPSDVAWHFVGVNVPKNATIDSAKVRVDVTSPNEAGTQNSWGQSFFQDEDTGSTLGTGTSSPAGWSNKTANQQWFTDWPTAGLTSLSVTSGIQAIVNRANWSSGNDINFGGTGFSNTNVYAHIDFGAYSQWASPTNTVARLIINYSEPGGDAFGGPFGGGQRYVRSKPDNIMIFRG